MRYGCGQPSKRKEKPIKKEEAIEKVIRTALAEKGYLEKSSASLLDSKTENVGSGNYTKYWRDILPKYQGQPWCAAFISWCFMQAFGIEQAEKLLRHWPYVYCPAMAELFPLESKPERGDICIFYRGGNYTHTGLVVMAADDGSWFETIEGNTSGASGVIGNGGGVCRKSYSLRELSGTKFCRPDYGSVSEGPEKDSQAEELEGRPSDIVSAAAMNGTDLVPEIRTALNRIPRRIGHVTARRLNIRQWAGTENPNIISFPVLEKGTAVGICDELKADDGSDWYYIKIAGKVYGFASAKYIA